MQGGSRGHVRDRRQAPSDRGSRRAPRWRELRERHPRVVTGTVLGVAAVLLMDGVLVYERVQYGRELARIRTAMTEVERQRADSIAASEENHLAIAVELARREALGDAELHLTVDTRNGLLCLERQGARLRETRVRLGREATVGTPPDTVLLAPPLGKRSVARVVDGAYQWAVPEWVYVDRGWPVPTNRRVPAALGPLAIFLDTGAVLYSRPAAGPLCDPGYVLPGSVLVEAADLEAIREDLQPGMAVYFH